MTKEQLKKWRLGRWRPGTKLTLRQEDAARLVCAKGGYRTWLRWEGGGMAVPDWMGPMLRLIDRANEYRREIQPETWEFIVWSAENDARQEQEEG